MFQQELMHLHIAESLLREYEGKVWQQVIPDAEFPAPLKLESNIDYVRNVLGSTVNFTAMREGYVNLEDGRKHETFEDYQQQVNVPEKNVMSHAVIEDYIRKNGMDYRFETAPNPVEALRDRRRDDTQTGRNPEGVLARV